MDSFSDDLLFANLRLWNFISFGPTETFLDLSNSLLSAVMGVNHDTGGEDSRNGTGKSALLVDAICYALFGKTLREDIKLAHLVHKLARKGQQMMVILEFKRGQFHYLIERGENPSKLNFFRKPLDDSRDFRHQEKVDGKKVFIFDLTQKKANTNDQIQQAIGFDFVLFPYLIANTSEMIPFFRLEEAKRRNIIESLFGFKRLSSIAEILKKDRDILNKELIGLTSSVSATEAANERIQKQIDGLEQQKEQFYDGFIKQRSTAEIRARSIEASIETVFEELLENPYTKVVYKSPEVDIEGLIKTVLNSQTDTDSSIPELTTQLSELEATYRNQLEAARNQLTLSHQSSLAELNLPEDIAKSFLSLPETIRSTKQALSTVQTAFTRLEKQIKQEETELNKLETATNCPTCGQKFTDDHLNHVQEQINQISKRIVELREESETLSTQMIKNNTIIQESTTDLNDIQTVEDDLSEQRKQLTNTFNADLKKIETSSSFVQMKSSIRTTEEKIKNLESVGEERQIAIDQASNLSDLLEQFTILTEKIESLAESCDPVKNPDPYTDQIKSLHENALVDISAIRQEIANKQSDHEHYQLLINLATKPDSFIRRQLIDQWLPVLNNRIADLLRQLELPHQVQFDSQMEMHISMLKSEYSNGNLSKGERTRLNVAINRAFQELFEVMNFRINLLVIDELIDNGICNRGAENSLRLLQDTVRDHKKRVFLITHRNDIQDKVDSILTVTKENDFSTIKWDDR